MNRRNRVEESTDPCGTLAVITRVSEETPANQTSSEQQFLEGVYPFDQARMETIDGKFR